MGRFLAGAGIACAAYVMVGATPVLAQVSGNAETQVSSARQALASEIVDLGVPASEREDIFFKTMDQMTVQMREAALQNVDTNDKEVIAILDRWIADWVVQSKATLRGHIPAIMDGWKAAYAEMYTEQELTDIRAFVATPSGAKFFARMQDVMLNPQFAKANQAYMNEIMAKLPGAQAQLMQQLQAHFEKKAKSR